MITTFVFLILLAPLYAQGWDASASGGVSRLNAGVELYGQGRWGDAINELRRAQAEARDVALRAEAQFWIAMSELSAGKFREALHSFDEVGRIDPRSSRIFEVPYQKGRANFYLGHFNEAVVQFKDYADSIQVDGRYSRGVKQEGEGVLDAYQRKSAAIYWIGESLYNLNELERAAEMFNIVINQYPSSVKHEISLNRIALIKQKKTEDGLLEIIRLSNTPQNVPPQQETVIPRQTTNTQAYNDAVLAYKNSIAPFLSERKEEAGRESAVEAAKKTVNQSPDTMMRLLNIKTQALEMMDRLVSTLNTFETIEWDRWERW
jgi:tetratricopeptide (TPR) repeat protein